MIWQITQMDSDDLEQDNRQVRKMKRRSQSDQENELLTIFLIEIIVLESCWRFGYSLFRAARGTFLCIKPGPQPKMPTYSKIRF